MAPSIVAWRMPSNDVHVGLLRVVQPPDDVQVMPAARNCDSALACVTADAAGARVRVPATARAAAATTVRIPERVVMVPCLPTPSRVVNVAAPVFEVAGTGADAVDYLAAWELQRQVPAPVVGGGRAH